MNRKIDDQLAEVRLAVAGVLENPEIMKKLEKLNYTKKMVQEGNAHINKIEMLGVQQDDGHGLQKSATLQLRAAKTEAHTLYMRHLSIARIALSQHPELWDVLKLKGVRKQAISGWIRQTSAFYNNISRVQDIMDKHGVTADEVAQGKAMIEAIASYQVQQSKGKSQKQQATQERQEARKALQLWMRDFLYIARYALKDNKQQLEALGQVV